MAKVVLFPDELWGDVKAPIKNFDNHGCGFGYDAYAQKLFRVLLDAIDRVQEIIEDRFNDVS
tara:strand:- start:804 stop:989 length:186 start_codon:yes stop_codon:yes gene_type:complete